VRLFPNHSYRGVSVRFLKCFEPCYACGRIKTLTEGKVYVIIDRSPEYVREPWIRIINDLGTRYPYNAKHFHVVATDENLPSGSVFPT
jgi:hypothetical protein